MATTRIPIVHAPLLSNQTARGLATASGGPETPSYDTDGLTILSSDSPVSWPLPDHVKATLSIDEAWSISKDDETGASFASLELSFVDLASWAQFTGKDLSMRVGDIIILRDSAGKLAWAYLG